MPLLAPYLFGTYIYEYFCVGYVEMLCKFACKSNTFLVNVYIYIYIYGSHTLRSSCYLWKKVVHQDKQAYV